MTRGEIVIDEKLCQGCEICLDYCARGCITASEDKLTSMGNQIAVFSASNECNACAICARMCPHSAIQVFRY